MVRLTNQELKNIVSSTLIRYIANETEVELDLERLSSLVKWVEAHNFEEILEEMRSEW